MRIEFGTERGTTVADEVPELQRSFGYAGGLEKPMAFAKFDVRDDVCLRVGGFAHGRVVRDRDGQALCAHGGGRALGASSSVPAPVTPPEFEALGGTPMEDDPVQELLRAAIRLKATSRRS